MANAKKCDRCGKCYDPASIKDNPGVVVGFSSPIFQTAEDYKNHRFTKTLGRDDDNNWGNNVDLCHECTREFSLFMQGCPLIDELGNDDLSEE